MLCREMSLVASGDGWGLAMPLKCRAWSCDFCAPERRAALVRFARSGEPNRFLTLTIRPDGKSTPAALARELARAWRLVVKRASRQLGIGKLEYLAVFERTKQGWPHLHILLRSGYLPQRWLSEQMRELVNSPIVWIEAITDTRKAAKYIAKYIGKDPHRFGKCKRYWSTRNYALDKEEDEDSPWGEQPWQTSKQSRMTLFCLWHDLGMPAEYLPAHDVSYWGSPPAALLRRWEAPEVHDPPGPSPCAVIGSAACTAPSF